MLLFPSTKSDDGKLRGLEEYVADMKEGQEDIYFITAPSLDDALKSPYIETFKDNDYEVLIMTDDIDDMVMGNLEYKGKKLNSVVKGDINLYKNLIAFIKDHLKDNLKDVRLSGRLKDSPCCLVPDEGGIDAQMEQLLKSVGQPVPENRKNLEINPSHPLFEAMNTIYAKDKESALLKEYSDLLYNQALLLEGSKPKDPASFVRSISKIMVDNAQHGG